MKEIRTIIVDDDPVCISDLCDLLNGFSNIRVISTFTNPLLVREAVHEMKPQLAFLDIEMPGFSGLDLAGQIRETHPEITIIFVTAYNQYAIQAIKKGAYDYLLKPIDPDELSRTVIRYAREWDPGKKLLKIFKAKYSLTPRELDIIYLIGQGFTSEAIAANLHISRLTVNKHRQNILKRTSCANFNELLGNM